MYGIFITYTFLIYRKKQPNGLAIDPIQDEQ